MAGRRDGRTLPCCRGTGSLAGALLALSLILAPAPARATDRSPCHKADVLTHANLLGEAASAYHAAARALRADPQRLHGCVARGLGELQEIREQRLEILQIVARRRLKPVTVQRLVGVLEVSGRPRLVVHVVAGGLRLGDGEYGIRIALALHRARFNRQANAVLRATLARFPFVAVPAALDGLAKAGIRERVAQALSRAGFDDAAGEELRAALEADPTATVPSELSKPDHRRWWWNRALGAAGPWLRTIGELLLIALIIVFVIVVLVRRVRSRIAFDDFEGGEDGLGGAIAAAVRSHYVRIRRDDGGTRLKVTDSSATDLDELKLPQGITDAIPASAFVAALLVLLDRLTPTRWWRVSGQLLHAHPVRGVGIQLTARRRWPKLLRPWRVLLREQTLWEQDYGPWPSAPGDATQENYDRLVVPAATWLMWATAKDHSRAFGAFNTRDWRSIACFAVGAELHTAGHPRAAQPRYRRALGFDPDNRLAQLNLAVAETQTGADGDRRRYERAVDTLLLLCDGAHAVHDDDPIWYRARYALAVALLRRRTALGRARARRRAAEVCARSAEVRARRSWPRSRRSQLDTFLQQLEPAALLLLASALYEESGRGRPPVEPFELEKTTLREQLVLARDGRHYAQNLHAGIVGYVLTHCTPLRPGTRYNLACYFIRVRDMREAEQHLFTALEDGDGGLRLGVIDDPALRPFTKGRGRRARLLALLEQLGVPLVAP
jgi:hypothetical protein